MENKIKKLDEDIKLLSRVIIASYVFCIILSLVFVLFGKKFVETYNTIIMTTFSIILMVSSYKLITNKIY